MFDAEVLMAPIIVFMVVVAPLWLILHYRSKKQVSQGLSEHEHRQLLELAQKADKMAERVETLEALLDQEAPQWRRKV
ncbi:envelope stress response membrane protein PspB [Pseudoalteromonas shioyasakiensis]|jgi:phage shock protein B|uniref:Envelope stress response membrane protein PspB n=4 Tax=Pseudoalteromonas TaxID=53246 RepID=A0A0P7D4B0_9GAMM|nr:MULTISPECIES: envelope stress response membrane protein PspB [Gammaproteobacteria]MAH27420.1 envelope stress response membrane protein PspB [Pseudoalteromonadaceae bacterium]MDC3191294.1 envelope stress response membrane protein PspB [Pseudoalteromonas elyakovii]MDX1353686.1 envelope stress response membrane protein PspB [Thiomicrorhabdus sp.]MEC8351082.1 envelope stress response membrane protein PspB [Pseudomonadota bacterium]UJX24530.1 envelope stress response membrane protein PspB [Pseud|tara:strand:- start:5381 stop:5614 length:234 start_codon:yes stop_codon:yes gene_type:complete